MRATILIGIGIMAAVDEIIFHQVLAWHHFFDRSTPATGLLSDGLLHSAELIVIVAGFFMFAQLHRRHALAPMQAWAGLFIGLGGFQLLDGLVSHKLLQIHQIRYVENILPYDLAWNVFALVLLAVGVVLAARDRRQARTG
jgi:uncharacterized membrane protein